jgi:uncharacterized protein YkwD
MHLRRHLTRHLARPLPTVAACVLSAVACLGTVIVSATPAAAKPTRVHSVRLNGFEARLLADMNRARRNHGLGALTVQAGTTDVARRWSWTLARQQSLEHNPSLITDLEHAGSARWTSIEENVGYGPASSPDELFTAYMQSPEHKANILGATVRYVGVGVVQRGEYAWNTVDFTNSYDTTYGGTRVPADGMDIDDVHVTHSTTLATATHADSRFGTKASHGMHASRVHFSRHAAQATFHGRHGRGMLVFREAMSLTRVRALRVRLGAVTHRRHPVHVTVELGNGWTSRTLGHFVVSHVRTVTVHVPRALRTEQSTISFVVSGKGLTGHRATLSLSRLRAVV